MNSAVEVTTRFVATVDSLAEAWAFVMDRVDRPSVGHDPVIQIRPVWQVSATDIDSTGTDWPRVFEVVVEGMVQENWS